MVGVDGKCLTARRMLLHFPLQLDRNGTIALALNVIAWNSTPPCRGCFDWRSKNSPFRGKKAHKYTSDLIRSGQFSAACVMAMPPIL